MTGPLRDPEPSRRLAVAALAVALLFALAGCGVSHAAGSASSVAAPSPRVGEVVNQTLPASIRTMPLQTASGTWTTLAAYAGRQVMIADFMTLCEDICPLITANNVRMARALQADGDGEKVALLEITLDPTRDTPARLRAYQKLYGATPADWTLLRASPADTKALWHYFGVYDHRVPEGKPADIDWLTGKPLTYDIDHSDDLIFLNGGGKERFVVDGSPDTQGQRPPHKLAAFLSGQGRHLLDHPNRALDWTVGQAMSVFSWLTDRHLPPPG